MTSCSEQEDLASEEALGVLCRCGHLLTDSDLYFCGYCGAPIVTTSGRRRAPAAVASGRRAALAALASERSAAADELATHRFAVPAPPAPSATPAVPATPAEEPSGPADGPESAVAVAAAAAAPPSVKRTARAARTARANRRTRHAGGTRGATAVAAVESVEPTAAPAEPADPASDDRVTAPPHDEPPTESVAVAPPVPSAGEPEASIPDAEPGVVAEPEPEPEVAAPAPVSGRRTWPAWLAVVVIVGASAVRTALGLLFTFPAYLTWLPVVLVALLAITKVARFSAGLVGVATAALTGWWCVEHVVSTARLQDLGYDVGYTTITVPLLLAAVGTVPLAVVLGALVDGRVRTTLREWVAGQGGVDTVRAAAVVLALLAALFPVVRSVSAEPGFAVLTAARDQVQVPGYPTPGQIADQMHATSVAKGRPVSVTCTYAEADVEPRPSYRCVAVSMGGSEAAEVHDGILSSGRPDGSYTCVDLTPRVTRRLC